MTSRQLLLNQVLVLAFLPIAIALVAIGLGTSVPALPVAVELAIVAVVGITPVFWLQWHQPIYIFCNGRVAIAPTDLNNAEQILLAQSQNREQRLLTVLVALLLLGLLQQIDQIAPLFAVLSPVNVAASGARFSGLVIASVGLAAAHFCAQVGLNAVRVAILKPELAEPAPLPQRMTIIGKP